MSDLFVIFISTCLVNNLALNHLLGLPPGIALSRKIDTGVGLAVTMVLVLTLTTTAAFPVKKLLLTPFDLEYLEPAVLLLIIALVLACMTLCLKRFRPDWHEVIAVFMPLTYINSAVMGTALLVSGHDYGLAGSLCYGLGSGVGYCLVITMLTAIEERLAAADIPAPFQGISIILITLGIMSMAFMGFTGLVTL